MDRIGNGLLWQLRDAFHRQRSVLGFFLILDITLWILPLSFCRFLDSKAKALVVLISLCYAFSLLMTFFYNIIRIRENPGARQNELWYLAEPNPWIRIFSRLAAGSLVTAIWFINGQIGTVLMKKFAAADHSYFEMELHHNIPGAYLQFALFLPLLYLFLNFISRRDREQRGKAILIIGALIIGEILMDAFRTFSRAGNLIAVFLLCVVLFWLNGWMSGKRDIP